MADELLRMDDVWSGYGDAIVLEGISLALDEGDSLALLGRNGMGKTTLIATLMGAARQTRGTIRFRGQDIARVAGHRRAHAGLGWVPQERDIFASLTVEENLTVVARPGAWNLKRVYATFARLHERRANMGNQLSGGEQQMLSIARALVTNPALLVLDEATEGLAPLVREEIWNVLAELRRAGHAMIVIDKYVQRLIAIADRAVVMEKGRVVWRGTATELGRDERVSARYLGV